MGNSEKPKFKYKFLVKFLVKIVILAILTYILLTYVLCFYRMSDNNMFPSVRDGDFCILYKLEDYHLNDVVLYKDFQGNSRLGRIVAVESQEVDFLEDGGYTVNGYEPSEEITYPTYSAENSSVNYPLVIGTDSFFILNDFRSDTIDSRQLGEIKDIQGKLIFILRRRGF